MSGVSTLAARPRSWGRSSRGMSVRTDAARAPASWSIRGRMLAVAGCWRGGRGARSGAGAGVDEGPGPGHPLHPRGDVDALEGTAAGRVGIVDDRYLDVDRHPAEGVDDLLEALEVDLDVVLDLDPVELAEDRLEGVVAAGLVGPGPEIFALSVLHETRDDLGPVDRTTH